MSETDPFEELSYRETGNPNEYIVEHPHGYVSFLLERETGLVEIDDGWVDPDFTRRGIMKNMLRYTTQVAHEIGGRVLSASIVSREGLDAMRSVFGEEHITVNREGNYGDPPDPDNEENFGWYASAYLSFPLE